jgi:hypothetical protein
MNRLFMDTQMQQDQELCLIVASLRKDRVRIQQSQLVWIQKQ